jgi:transcriptional regulator with XRE-family HTH domain
MSDKRAADKFGVEVKRRREEQGLSQEQLAELADIDRTYISMIERGKRNPTLEVAERIAVALDMKLSELIKRAEKASK